MRILRVANIPDNRTGGMSRTMYCTGDYLIEMGHQVNYLFSQHLQIAAPGRFKQWLAPFRIPGLVEQLRQQGKHFDIVELHEAIAAPYCFMRQFRPHLPPSVIFSYGIEKRLQLAELTYNTQKELPISPSLRYFRLTVAQSMYALRHADHVICSNAEDVSYLKQLGIPESQLTQHHSGADREFLLASADVVQKDQPRSGILFLGSWIYRKGILDLVAAMTDVLQQHSALQLTIAGCGKEVETVLSIFPEPLHSRITVIPKLTSNEELIDIYRRHAIFVLPSYFEGQPLAMMEAAAMGLAIVTTNVCGMLDFIDHDVNGLLVPVGDAEKLREALTRLVDSPETALRLGKAARRKVREFTWQRAGEKILDAYHHALKHAHHASQSQQLKYPVH
jgi:glycosyltransferase involved in cell wall biosynthesis